MVMKESWSKVREATIVVAASDSLSPKAADYRCSGANDQVQIQAAIDAAGPRSTVKMLGGTYYCSDTLTLTADRGQTLDARDTIIEYSGTNNAFELLGTSVMANTWEGELKLGQLIATGAALTADIAGVYIYGWCWAKISGLIEAFRGGRGIQIDSLGGGSPVSTWGITFPKLFCRDCQIGVEFTGNGAIHWIHFGDYWWSPEADQNDNYGMKDNNSGGGAKAMRMNYVWLEPQAWVNPRGLDLVGGSNEIGTFVWDGPNTTDIVIKSAQPISIWNLTPVSGGGNILDSQLDIPPESILGRRMPANAIVPGRLLHVPTNGGWASNHANTGGAVQGVTYQQVYTAAGASSRGLVSTPVYAFNIAGQSANRTNWDRLLYIIFVYTRAASDAEVIARFQWKETNAEGALAAKGIGVRVDNLALMGESYGVALGVVNLGTALVSGRGYKIMIILDPDTPKIEWYVDRILVGTQSTVNNIPSGNGGAAGQFVHSIINGVTGGVACDSLLQQLKISQE